MLRSQFDQSLLPAKSIGAMENINISTKRFNESQTDMTNAGNRSLKPE